MKVKEKVKMDRTHLWCCDLILIRPFPAKFVYNCPECGMRKPSQSTGLL